MSSLRTFDPQSLDFDIYIQDVQGLGRGRGFKVVGKRSALGTPSVTQPIKGRLLDLAVMLYEEKLLSEKELAKRFGLISSKDHQALEKERNELQTDLEEAQDQLKEAEEECDVAKAELEEAKENFSDRMNKLVHLIADALEEDSGDWEVETKKEDEAYATLKHGTERLIEDYQALKAEEGEES